MSDLCRCGHLQRQHVQWKGNCKVPPYHHHGPHCTKYRTLAMETAHKKAYRYIYRKTAQRNAAAGSLSVRQWIDG